MRLMTSSALIVGASRGIGAGLVRQFLDHGWHVHATVRNLDDPGELAALHDRVTLHQFDVRDGTRTSELAAELAANPLDVVIHNAGIYRGHSEEQLNEVNTVAPIRTAEALLDAGSIAEGGKLALMTSQLGARRGSEEPKTGYGGSKARLNDEFRARSDRWRGLGILAVVIHPGWVRTDMGGPGASISVEESVSGIYRLMVDLTPDQHGRFWTWQGREHPW